MIFDIDQTSNQELKEAINQMVNEAISSAIRAGMTSADASVRVQVHLISRSTSAGKSVLEPKYKYNTKIKIGENWEAGKGKLDSPYGLLRDEDGNWHQQALDEQLSM